MNILVIGNGFDLAQGLPTRYKDFLKFTDVFSMLYESYSDGKSLVWKDSDNTRFVEWILDLLNDSKKNEISRDFVNEFNSVIKDNIWIKHFKVIAIDEGWVDFEIEISRVIQGIDNCRKYGKRPRDYTTGEFRDSAYEYAFRRLHHFLDGNSDGSEEVTLIKQRLLNDLNKLTRAIEMYLSSYVEDLSSELDTVMISEIYELEIDGVISFNYTRTYEKKYDNRRMPNGHPILYDYIHGVAKKGIDGMEYNIENCNLVLGVDEYLPESERDNDNEFIEFKKFYQRIYKKTGCEYRKWLNSYSESIRRTPGMHHQNINIYIYGHSLDVTDKDILSELIRQENAVTTIYYHNKEVFGQQISNLVKVLGEAELIERTGGYRPTIVFKQTDNNSI